MSRRTQVAALLTVLTSMTFAWWHHNMIRWATITLGWVLGAWLWWFLVGFAGRLVKRYRARRSGS